MWADLNPPIPLPLRSIHDYTPDQQETKQACDLKVFANPPSLSIIAE